MPRGKEYTSFILKEKDSILQFIGPIDNEMCDFINSKVESEFILFYKHLTHSDIATFGKATQRDSHSKNLLYYITENDMKTIEEQTGKPFQTAHQSCIGLSTDFYETTGLPNPRENDPYLINDYARVYLVNKNMEYFNSKYTKVVFDKLNKDLSTHRSWDFDNLDVELSNEMFTSISLHVAVHGLGMEQDEDFHKIRHHLFKGDTLILLFEKDLDSNNLYVMFEKNPIFFSIIGEINTAYVEYLKKTRERLINVSTLTDNAVNEQSLEDEVTRQEQSKWRDMLAKEMMGYTQDSRQIFCPLTYISVDYDKLGTLFVASHIKGFKDPNTTNEEKYDINNGILICANADALFDKHLITIDENKQLKFSFLLDDVRLKQQLLLLQPIFTPILNDKRMEYLKYHRSVFEMKEEERKTI